MKKRNERKIENLTDQLTIIKLNSKIDLEYKTKEFQSQEQTSQRIFKQIEKEKDLKIKHIKDIYEEEELVFKKNQKFL